MEQAQQESLGSLFKPLLVQVTPKDERGSAPIHVSQPLTHFKDGNRVHQSHPEMGKLAVELPTRGSLAPERSALPRLESQCKQSDPDSTKGIIQSASQTQTRLSGMTSSDLPGPSNSSSMSNLGNREITAKEISLASAILEFGEGIEITTILLVDGPAQTMGGGPVDLPMFAPPSAALPIGPAPLNPTLPAPVSHQAFAPSIVSFSNSVGSLATGVFTADPVDPTSPSVPQPSRTVSVSNETAEAPVRLYAEWSEDGVRIWVGANAGQPLHLEQLALQMRLWLARQGERLAALFCNGQAVWEEAEASSIHSEWNAKPLNDDIFQTIPAYLDPTEAR